MRGRPPKTVEQRAHEGTLRPDRHPQPLLVAGRPELEEFREPPENLPERAKEFWREVVVDLVRAGLVDRVDRPALRMLSVQWDRWEKAMEVLNAEGLVSLGSMGQMVEHPMLKTERNAHELFLKTSEHFALTPVARTRLGLAELHRRTMAQEMHDVLGGPTPVGDVDGTYEDVTDLDVGGLTESYVPDAEEPEEGREEDD